MRISDWSSDVCSSDLGRVRGVRGRGADDLRRAKGGRAVRYGGTEIAAPDANRDGGFSFSGGLLVVAADSGRAGADGRLVGAERSAEHTSELQSLMRISYAVFCLQIKKALNLNALV